MWKPNEILLVYRHTDLAIGYSVTPTRDYIYDHLKYDNWYTIIDYDISTGNCTVINDKGVPKVLAYHNIHRYAKERFITIPEEELEL